MNRTSIITLALTTIPLFPLACRADESKVEKPNIILILADDLGNADLGYNGCKDIKTPNIDKLAASGIVLNDHHTTASVCAPSRAGALFRDLSTKIWV